MNSSTFSKIFFDHRRSIIGWVLAFVLLTVFYVAFFPVMKNSSMGALLENYPQALRQMLGLQDMSSPAGFLKAAVFNLIAPLMMIAFGLFSGSWVIGEDEENGTLDLLLSQPISRIKLVVSRTLAAVLVIFILAFSVFFAVAVSGPFVKLTVSLGGLASICLMLALLGCLFQVLTILITCLWGRLAIARASCGFIAIFTYLLSSFASQVDGVTWSKYCSPFYYYTAGDPLVSGLSIENFLSFVVVLVLLVLVSVWGFNNRDIRSV